MAAPVLFLDQNVTSAPFIASQVSNVVGQIANLPWFWQVSNLPHGIAFLKVNSPGTRAGRRRALFVLLSLRERISRDAPL